MKNIESNKSELLRNRILNAIKNGRHTLPEMRNETGLSDTQIVHELELMENLEVVRISDSKSPVTSWWLKTDKPNGKIIRGDDGKLTVKKLPKKDKIQIPEPNPVQPLAVCDKSIDSRYLPVTALEIHPDNPRGVVNVFEQSFLDLVQSVKADGVHQLLVVKQISDIRFRVVMGHRRLEAAKRAGLEFVPCEIRTFANDEAEYDAMLAENIQRENLSPLHEAKALLKRYIELNRDLNALAFAVNKPQNWIKARLIVAEKLEDDVQELYDQRKIGISNAVRLSRIEKTKQRKYVRQAMTMKYEDFKKIVEAVTDGKLPPPKWERRKKERVTTDDEIFDRPWAIKKLNNAGDTYIPAAFFAKAFDDICQDSCDKTACRNCPAPRMIAAVLRHHKRSEQNA